MQSKRLFLPKPLYELVPFVYLILGASCIVMDHSIGLALVGAYLIAQGLFKSILRLNYRSPSQALRQGPFSRRDR